MSTGRARVTFYGAATDEQRANVQQALDRRFNNDTMVGHFDVEMALEPEGWRVITAWATSFPPAASPSDARVQVIQALRSDAVPLAHEKAHLTESPE